MSSIETNDRSFRFVSRYLLPPGRTLDIGRGNGRFMYVAHKAGWNVKGLELSPVVAKFVRECLGAAVATRAVECRPGAADTGDDVLIATLLPVRSPEPDSRPGTPLRLS